MSQCLRRREGQQVWKSSDVLSARYRNKAETDREQDTAGQAGPRAGRKDRPLLHACGPHMLSPVGVAFLQPSGCLLLLPYTHPGKCSRRSRLMEAVRGAGVTPVAAGSEPVWGQQRGACPPSCCTVPSGSVGEKSGRLTQSTNPGADFGSHVLSLSCMYRWGHPGKLPPGAPQDPSGDSGLIGCQRCHIQAEGWGSSLKWPRKTA